MLSGWCRIFVGVLSVCVIDWCNPATSEASAPAIVIEHVPPDHGTIDEPLVIHASVHPSARAFKPSIYWRNVGERKFHRVAMVHGSGDEFETTLRAVRGDIEYYAEAYDDQLMVVRWRSSAAPYRVKMVPMTVADPAPVAHLEPPPPQAQPTATAVEPPAAAVAVVPPVMPKDVGDVALKAATPAVPAAPPAANHPPEVAPHAPPPPASPAPARAEPTPDRSSTIVLSAPASPPKSASEQDASAQKPLRLGLMSVTQGEGYAEQVSTIEELLLSALTGTGRFKVIGRRDIDTLLTYEARKQAAGCSDDAACMIEIAGALGIDLLATANVGRVGKTTVVTLSVLNVSTGVALVHARRTIYGDEDLVHATEALAKEAATSVARELKLLPTDASPRLHRTGLVSTIAGGVALVVAIVLGISVKTDTNNLDNAVAGGKETIQGRVNNINARAVTADVLYGVGGAATAAGIGFMVTF